MMVSSFISRLCTMLFLARALVSLVACSQVILAAFNDSSTESDGSRIAVIGAGAGGSSFSYYLQRYTSHHFNVTVFEANNYIGGRSTTVGHYASAQATDEESSVLESDVELGASVFISANYILTNAVEEFGLTLDTDLPSTYPEYFTGSMGMWDGSEFVYSSSGSTSFLDELMGSISMILKYNFSIFRFYIDLNYVVNTFLSYFYESAFPFDMATIVSEAGLDTYTDTESEPWMLKKWYSSKFLNDLAQPITRANYRSNLDDIHLMGTFISGAGSTGGMAVKGGNYLIFENFLDYSDADVHLGTNVTKISKNDDGTYDLTYTDDEGTSTATFDQVVIAAPLQFTGIEFEGVEVNVQPVEYRTLYAAYIETDRTNLVDKAKYGDDVPESIFTTSDDVPYYSLQIVDYDNSTDRVRYKIFINETLTESFLSKELFSDMTNVEIWFQHEWHPYPRLEPTSDFDGFEVAEGLWYLNSMERFCSTMETSALAGASVAGQIAKGYNTEDIVLP